MLNVTVKADTIIKAMCLFRHLAPQLHSSLVSLGEASWDKTASLSSLVLVTGVRKNRGRGFQEHWPRARLLKFFLNLCPQTWVGLKAGCLSELPGGLFNNLDAWSTPETN